MKERAAAGLGEMGLTLSDAIRMFQIRTAAEKALPFYVRVPNPVTAKAIEELEQGKGKAYKSADALFKDLGL